MGSLHRYHSHSHSKSPPSSSLQPIYLESSTTPSLLQTRPTAGRPKGIPAFYWRGNRWPGAPQVLPPRQRPCAGPDVRADTEPAHGRRFQHQAVAVACARVLVTEDSVPRGQAGGGRGGCVCLPLVLVASELSHAGLRWPLNLVLPRLRWPMKTMECRWPWSAALDVAPAMLSSWSAAGGRKQQHVHGALPPDLPRLLPIHLPQAWERDFHARRPDIRNAGLEA